jgi:hypothetical protein
MYKRQFWLDSLEKLYSPIPQNVLERAVVPFWPPAVESVRTIHYLLASLRRFTTQAHEGLARTLLYVVYIYSVSIYGV